jgi:hypothetical protein
MTERRFSSSFSCNNRGAQDPPKLDFAETSPPFSLAQSPARIEPFTSPSALVLLRVQSKQCCVSALGPAYFIKLRFILMFLKNISYHTVLRCLIVFFAAPASGKSNTAPAAPSPTQFYSISRQNFLKRTKVIDLTCFSSDSV